MPLWWHSSSSLMHVATATADTLFGPQQVERHVGVTRKGMSRPWPQSQPHATGVRLTTNNSRGWLSYNIIYATVGVCGHTIARLDIPIHSSQAPSTAHTHTPRHTVLLYAAAMWSHWVCHSALPLLLLLQHLLTHWAAGWAPRKALHKKQKQNKEATQAAQNQQQVHKPKP